MHQPCIVSVFHRVVMLAALNVIRVYWWARAVPPSRRCLHVKPTQRIGRLARTTWVDVLSVAIGVQTSHLAAMKHMSRTRRIGDNLQGRRANGGGGTCALQACCWRRFAWWRRCPPLPKHAKRVQTLTRLASRGSWRSMLA